MGWPKSEKFFNPNFSSCTITSLKDVVVMIINKLFKFIFLIFSGFSIFNLFSKVLCKFLELSKIPLNFMLSKMLVKYSYIRVPLNFQNSSLKTYRLHCLYNLLYIQSYLQDVRPGLAGCLSVYLPLWSWCLLLPTTRVPLRDPDPRRAIHACVRVGLLPIQ